MQTYYVSYTALPGPIGDEVFLLEVGQRGCVHLLVAFGLKATCL